MDDSYTKKRDSAAEEFAPSRQDLRCGTERTAFKAGADWCHERTVKAAECLFQIQNASIDLSQKLAIAIKALDGITKQRGTPPEFVVEDCHEIAKEALEKLR